MLEDSIPITDVLDTLIDKPYTSSFIDQYNSVLDMDYYTFQQTLNGEIEPEPIDYTSILLTYVYESSQNEFNEA